MGKSAHTEPPESHPPWLFCGMYRVSHKYTPRPVTGTNKIAKYGSRPRSAGDFHFTVAMALRKSGNCVAVYASDSAVVNRMEE